MTGERFDELTRSLGAPHTRRRFVGRLGLALGIGSVAALGLSLGAAGAARGITPACARLGQAGDVCCPGLVHDVDGVCRYPVGANCRDDADCIDGAACLPTPGRLGMTCQAA